MSEILFTTKETIISGGEKEIYGRSNLLGGMAAGKLIMVAWPDLYGTRLSACYRWLYQVVLISDC